MMDMFHAEYLVVLGPAIVSAIWAFWALGLPAIAEATRELREWFAVVMGTEEFVSTMKDFLVNAAFLGPAVGVVVGIGADTSHAYYLAVAFFLGASLGAITLSKLLVQINTREAKERHKKTAGTVRSIARSELLRATSGEPAKDDALKKRHDDPTMETPAP